MSASNELTTTMPRSSVSDNGRDRPPHRAHVLIVTDQLARGRELEARLTRLGYVAVGTARSVAEAIRQPDGLKPQLILLDQSLVKRTGEFDVPSRLRDRFEAPIVVYSSDFNRANAHEIAPHSLVIQLPCDDWQLTSVLEARLEQHRSAMRLQQLELWISETIGEVADAIVTVDHNGVITTFNHAAHAITGWSRDQAIGRSFRDVLNLSSSSDYLPICLDDAAAVPVVCLADETLLRTKSGEYRAVDLSATPLLEDDDRPSGILIVFRELASRRSGAIAQLSADIGLAAAQTSAMPEMLKVCAESLVRHLDAVEVTVWTANAMRDTLVLQASAGCASSSSHMRDAIQVGRGEIGWVAANRSPMVTNDVPGDPRTQCREWSIREGARAFAGYPLLVDEKLIGVLGVFTRRSLADGTLASIATVASTVAVGIERKRLEEQLRQTSKMEAIGQLAGGVAHDFNNLLTIINGWSEIIRPQLPASSPAKESLEEISQAGKRAASLTRQLLAFSRKQVLAPRVLDMNSVILDLEKLLRRLIGEDVSLTTSLEPSLGRVKTDPGQIEQVLMNLVVNSRDAMPRGGKLHIGTANVELDADYVRVHPHVTPGSYVRLTISDTGVGMDEVTKARLFEPFFTTKSQGKGTGLGLATVYGIVTQSGGHIAVDSRVGRGATFRVFLPRCWESPVGGVADLNGAAAPNGTETILLTEDEVGVRALARHVLKMNGYHVLEAEHGKHALRIAAEHAGPIHLLLTDVIMPEMNGGQLADHLSQERPDLKVLFLSGYTSDVIAEHGLGGVETEFLQKPFTPSALSRKVREVLDRHGRRSTFESLESASL